MSSQSDKITMFQSITGATDGVARDFLSRAGWNVEMGLSNYFEAGLEAATPPPAVAPPVLEAGGSSGGGGDGAAGGPLADPNGDEVCALVTGEGTALPLAGATVHAVVLDLVADVDVVFRFVNTSESTVEASFMFRNDDVAVCGFEAQVGDLQIEGVVEEKAKAKAAYQRAVNRGDGAFLLEEGAHEGVLALKIGNLLSGQCALIRLRYVMELEMEGDQVVFPLSLSRMPIAQVALAGEPSPEDAAAEAEVPDGLAITLSASMPCDIVGTESLTHSLRVEGGQTGETVEVTVDGPLGGADVRGPPLTVLFQLAEPHNPRLEVQTSGVLGDDALMMTIVPQAEDLFDPETETVQLSELIFLVDRSGSMAGSRMKQAKNALQLFLRSIPLGARFNIISFGSRYEKLFPSSVVYSDRTLAQARAHVAGMKADLNQTDILPPLRDIFSVPQKDGVPRQLLILTDGEVPNTSEVLTFARTAAAMTRVFTFGIGADASRTLVKGLASAGRGYAEFVQSGQRIERVVARQLQRALQPAITNATISWGGLADKVLQCPSTLPPLFAGQPFTIYALIDGDRNEGAIDGQHTLTLSGETAASSFELSLDFDVAEDVIPGDLVHRIAARNLIKQLERNLSRPGPAGKAARARIVRLATKYSLLSSCTSFLALDKRDADERRAVLRSQLLSVEVDPAAAGDAAASEAGVRPDLGPIGVLARGAPDPMLMQHQQQPLDPYAADDLLDNIQEQMEAVNEISLSLNSQLATQGVLLDSAPVVRQEAAAQPTQASSGLFSGFTNLFKRSAPSAAPAPAPAPARRGATGSARGRGGQSNQRRRTVKKASRSGGGGGGWGSRPGAGAGAGAPAPAPAGAAPPPPAAQAYGAPAPPPPAPIMVPDYTGNAEGSLASPVWAELEKSRDTSAFGYSSSAVLGEQLASRRTSLLSEDASSGSDDDAAAWDDDEGEMDAFGLILDDALRPVDKIIMLQGAKGSWHATPALESILGLSFGVGAPVGTDDELWATAVVIAYLRTHMAAEEDEWIILVDKAMRWLRASAGSALDSIMDAAAGVV